MKIKILSGIILLAAIITINSCENKSVPLPAVVVPKSCDTLNLTYSSGTNTMKPIIDAQCGTSNNSCHSPSGASHYDYSTYSGVLANITPRNLVYQSLFGNGSVPMMPLTAQPGWSDSSSCMLAKFKAWLNAGAKQ